MKVDGIELRDGSVIHNMTVSSGPDFPAHPNDGEFFFRITSTEERLYLYSRNQWSLINDAAPPLGFTPVNIAGDTMQGSLILAHDPLLGLEAATKHYVDAAIAGIVLPPCPPCPPPAPCPPPVPCPPPQPSGVIPGIYRSVTVDVLGRVVDGTNPSTLAGYGILDAQPLNANLSRISLITCGDGYLKKIGSDWVLDNDPCSKCGHQKKHILNFHGEVNGTAVLDADESVEIKLKLSRTGVDAGRYGNAHTIPILKIDAHGRVHDVDLAPVHDLRARSAIFYLWLSVYAISIVLVGILLRLAFK